MHNRGALKIFLAVLYSVIFLLFGNFINKNTLLAYELSFRVLNNSTKTISKIEFLPVKQNFNSNEKIIWDINNFPLRDGDFTDIQIIGEGDRNFSIYDIKIFFNEKDFWVWKRFNLLTLARITITNSGKANYIVRSGINLSKQRMN